MKKILLGVSLALIAAKAGAMDAKYQYCEIAGLANGTGRHFTGLIAGRLVERDGLQGDEVCTAVWSAAYKHGERMDKTAPNSLSEDDVRRFVRLSKFEEKLADGLIRAAGL